jgi:hypothetical protein
MRAMLFQQYINFSDPFARNISRDIDKTEPNGYLRETVHSKLGW